MRRSLRVVTAAVFAGLVVSPLAAHASQAPVGSHHAAPAVDVLDDVFITGKVTWLGKGVDDITVAAYAAGKTPVASGLTYEGLNHDGDDVPHGYFALLVPPGVSYKVVVSGGKDYQDITKTVSAGKGGGSASFALTKVLTNTTAPSIVGKKVAAGSKLTVDAGSWSADAPSFAYQWFSNGKPLKKATGSSYTVAKTDAGKKLTVAVTATADGYTSATATTAPVTVAKPKPTKHKKH